MDIPLPSEIEEFLDRLFKGGHEVWLIGSRANGTANKNSDWDFVIFGSTELLAELESQTPIDRLDPLVVYDGDSFKSPWLRPRDGATKSGSLSSWKWRKLSAESATYHGEQWDDDREQWGKPERAIRVRRDVA